MSADSDWEWFIDSKFLSMIGALLGGLSGSVASSVFGRSILLDSFYGVVILVTGVFLGLLGGVRSKGHIRKHYGKPAEESAARIASYIFALLGVPIILLGGFIWIATFEVEFASSGFTVDFILQILIGILFWVFGSLWILWFLGYFHQIENSD